MKRHILITRPQADALPLKHRLEVLGYTASIEPLITITPARKTGEYIKKALAQKPQAILITSKNALRILAGYKTARQYTLFVVGDATLALAKQLGFKRARKAGDTAKQLCATIKRAIKPTMGALFYPAGSDVSVDIPATLAPAGFKVIKRVVYKATAIHSFSSPTRKKLSDNKVDAVLLFSARTASTFVSLTKKAGAEPPVLFCLSRNVRATLPAGYKAFCCAPPTEQSLLDCLLKKLPPTV